MKFWNGRRLIREYFIKIFKYFYKLRKTMDVTFSTNASIIIQFITGVIGFIGIFISVAPEDVILIDILKIELVVQVIEFLFYIFILRHFAQNVSGMAAARYFDWFITTPTMLFTTIVYFKYEEFKQNNKEGPPLTLSQFIRDNQKNIGFIFVFNLLMLLFGYLGEIGLISYQSGFVLGTISFAFSFGLIYSEYAKNSIIGNNIYLYLFIIWAIYGIAYLLPDIAKNNTINILDLFAKNFFGIFLYFKIKSVQQ